MLLGRKRLPDASPFFPPALIVLYSLLYSTTVPLCQQTISPETAVPTHLGHPSTLTFNLPNLPTTHLANLLPTSISSFNESTKYHNPTHLSPFLSIPVISLH